MQNTPAGDRRVALLTLGCARNEVDSEELAARLASDGWRVSTDAADADVVLVNTCGFVASAKQDSIDTLLAAADTGAKVVATGCMAERYGRELANSLPEADAVLGFDHYPDMSARLSEVLDGRTIESHVPRDRRTLLPLTPVERRTADVVVPGHLTVDEHTPAHLRGVLRRRLDSGPVASLKLASGCDRRCAFCAIPSFRGAFVSRTPDEILAEAEWLARSGVRELVLVSENSTSYGKDLGDPRLLEKLLPQLAAVDGIVRVRASYLQPAETRPGLVEVIATTPGVAPYFDLSFQHASEPVLRRMRRFGSTERFLDLLASARALDSEVGARSNFIVGFPGETRADVDELVRFLEAARLDAVGVFAYSDEDGTEAATLPGKVRSDTIRRRYQKVTDLVEQLCAQRAEDRVGSTVEVLVDSIEGDEIEGRAAHQAPEVDGSTTLVDGGLDLATLRPGDLVAARVTGSSGVDLVAVPEKVLSPAARRDG
ncbi:30S ribosomal protein S12 methylthiotransferase RimO [Planosporangium flavigriseum]|uniref:Ribosomal protein uS12 methylthiotransferase RimO n=1 Tax=Planosporangium flavigriseum TaxID=373681 RepID=A0A8J3LH88_9ACTN|nr:30S ribosomal protein S12 methylthiotransferase RimO [Planosporangium flavigriseum]NJC64046.1 30S ribosomal protein S12 methylthiotransferase RimO [Planosporangium flavigriseum]GIG72927.1 ribosomal protein S12 methylthiotransferase RimO [Planosporangium flavigriseum]